MSAPIQIDGPYRFGRTRRLLRMARQFGALAIGAAVIVASAGVLAVLSAFADPKQ